MEKTTSFVNYQDNQLHFDNYNINQLKGKYLTPLYLYSHNVLKENYLEFDNAIKDAGINGQICFALKSNPNLTLLKKLNELGAGADIVSGGELERALNAGVCPSKIVFSGVGKTAAEIDYGIQAGIYSFNVESTEELELIQQRAQHFNKKVAVAFRLNPKVKAITHKHISTGFKTHKFGLLAQDILEVSKNKTIWEHVQLKGLSVHIGSQLTELEASREAFEKLAACANSLDHDLEFLDVGGGLGVNYAGDEAPGIDAYMKVVKEGLSAAGPKKVVFEPGRRIVAQSGMLVTSVIRNKKSEDCHFLIVDGGMNDFVRPSLYGAYHEIYEGIRTEHKVKTDIVGPICETADCFGESRELSEMVSGDLLAISHTGAYGYSMASHYNLRKKPIELMIDKDHRIKVINNQIGYE